MLPKILKTLMTATGQTPYTFDWPRVTDPVPMDIDPSAATVGPLQFGDPIDAAQVFGKHDEYLRYQGLACGLVYHSRGFHLEFDSARCFSFCSFFLSPDTARLKDVITYTQVVIKGRRAITGQTRAADLISMFGKPVEESKDSDGSALTFDINALKLDFSFSAEDRLVDVDIFPRENQQADSGRS